MSTNLPLPYAIHLPLYPCYLRVEPTVAWSSQLSCQHFLVVWMTGVHHHTRLESFTFIFLISPFPFFPLAQTLLALGLARSGRLECFKGNVSTFI